MSAPKVDVMAVLDEAADWLYRSSEGRGDDQRAANVKQARAAVAELIEALNLIATTDPVDAALDPDRAVRVARKALAAIGSAE